MSDMTARSAASFTDSEAALLASVEDPLGRPRELVSHPADCPIKDAAAIDFDGSPYLGFARPPKCRAPGHVIFLRPCRHGHALRDRDDELALFAQRDVFRT